MGRVQVGQKFRVYRVSMPAFMRSSQWYFSSSCGSWRVLGVGFGFRVSPHPPLCFMVGGFRVYMG